MKHIHYASIIILFLLPLYSAHSAEVPRVVTSIAPIHALTSAVMGDLGEPTALLKSNTSPHNYVLSPQEAQNLSEADIVFYVSDNLENFLQKPLKNLSNKARIIPLIKAPSLVLLPSRKEILWENTDKHDEGHGHDVHEEEHEHHHNHGAIDPHIWLDPDNAIVLLHHIANILAEEDAENAEKYHKNAEKSANAIAAKDKQLMANLASYQHVPYLVFHDGYQYFETHYGLHPTGALTRSPETPLGAKTLSSLTRIIKTQKIHCLFSEPQFSAKITDTLSQTLSIQTSLLNPLGKPNETYIDLLEAMTDTMVSCLHTDGS